MSSSIQVVIDREQWIKEAEEAEKAGAPLTCGAIVRATVHIGVEEEDRKRWVMRTIMFHWWVIKTVMFHWDRGGK